MDTFQAIAWPVSLIVYGHGREIAKIDKGPHQSYASMERLLNSHGYDIASGWTKRKLNGETVFFVTVSRQ